MGCHRVDQRKHLLGQFPDLPLCAAAAPQVEKVLQAAGIHGHDHLRLAGVRQDEAGVLIGLLGGLGTRLFFGHSLGHQAGGVPLLQLPGKIEIAFCVLVHALDKSSLCLGDGLDLGRDHIAEVVQPNIPLALDAERRDPVPGDLRQQGAADALDAKGEAGVLDGAGMTQIAEHIQKPGCLFLVQSIQQIGDVRIGIAELGRCCHHLFRFRGMGDQSNGHHFCHSSVVIFVSGAKLAMVFFTPTFSKRISTI